MKSDPCVKKSGSPFRKSVPLFLLAMVTGVTGLLPAQAATNVVIWDTGSPFVGTIASANRAAWIAVPSELFVLEAEPAKAASDPGYYGREYSFKGDAVVENRGLIAVFASAKGRVILYAKARDAGPGSSDGAGDQIGFGYPIVELAPAQAKNLPAKIGRCAILRNAADEAMIEVSFGAQGSPGASAIFSFGKNDIVEIKPAPGMNGMHLYSPVEYGLVPGFIGDDLIFGPADFGTAEAIRLPADGVFLGLLQGGASEFVMTWPKGKQQLTLRAGNKSEGRRGIDSIEFENDGQIFCLAPLSSPGLWHREELKPAYLEKDAPLSWKRPFPARWKTQLIEAGVKTTFAFREAKGTVWRGVPGSYNYPAWFDGGNAFFHLSKKVPPKGEALIYFLEGQETPDFISTPVDLVKATLGRQVSDSILDPAGRKLRTHHRRGGDGVHRACTCGCTEAIQTVFEKGTELTSRTFVKEALDDMKFFVDCHVERIEEYRKFAGSMLEFLKAKAMAAPELKSYLDNLEQIVQQIPQEYSVQKENMKSPEHMADLTRKTMSLTTTRSTNNLASYMELLNAWRAMGGAQDYVVAQCHMITRKLFQEAGYGCVNDAKAVPVAQEVRARCRQVLRNPDGYEIWANY